MWKVTEHPLRLCTSIIILFGEGFDGNETSVTEELRHVERI